MKKLLVIKSSKQSTWGSCKVISPNLLAAYESNQDHFNIQYFDIPEVLNKENIDKRLEYIGELVHKIEEFKPDNLVFVDHLPLPGKILVNLLPYMKLSSIPPLIFHVYGDFTYFANDWALLTEKFKGHNIKFVVASDAQKNLMTFFLNQKGDCVEKFLFPVNGNEYYYDHDERVKFRQSMNVLDHEKVILYSGRISLQKNVDILVKEFSHIVLNSKNPVRLWIVGAFDDIGAPFLGVKNHEGFMYFKIQKILNSLPKEVSDKVYFWGMRKKEELRKIKAASDMFISLSLYHDEDYGMSPAEALACGLPSLLTNWGGYYSFESSHKWNCKLVPVEITNFGHKMQIKRIHEFYQDQAQLNVQESDRHKWSREFMNEFSIQAAAVKLKKILEKEFQPFQGFDWSLSHYANLYWTSKPGEEINEKMTPSKDTFYYDVYKNYIKVD